MLLTVQLHSSPIMSPIGVGGHIGFGVDPVGICVAFCVNCSIDFDQTCTGTYLE